MMETTTARLKFTQADLDETLKKSFIKEKSDKLKSTKMSVEAARAINTELEDLPSMSDIFANKSEKGIDYNSLDRDARINLYRRAAEDIDCSSALEEIISEVIQNFDMPSLDVSNIPDSILSKTIMTSLSKEFKNILSIIKYSKEATNMFERLFVDGLIVGEIVYDNANIKKGVIDFSLLSPFGFKEAYDKTGEFIGYCFTQQSVFHDPEDIDRYVFKKEQIAKATMTKKVNYNFEDHLQSGDLLSQIKSVDVGYIHPILKYVEAKQNHEFSLAVYRQLFSYPRYAFSVPIGKLNKTNATTYIKTVRERFKNDFKFNTQNFKMEGMNTVESLRDHFVFPVRNGESVSVDQVMGGDTSFIKDQEDIEYFIRKIYLGLHIPVSRLDESSTLDFSGTDILMLEKKFLRYVRSLQNKFQQFLLEVLKYHVIAKQIITLEEWKAIEGSLNVSFPEEQKSVFINHNIEMYDNATDTYSQMKESGVVGKLISYETVMTKIFNMSLEEAKSELKKIEEEKKSKEWADFYAEPAEPEGGGGRYR